MSGGHFQYHQYKIGYIADEVDDIISNNDSDEKNAYGDAIGLHLPTEIIDEFKAGLFILRQAQIYAHRIDWLLSGDDGEDSFLRRLKSDLAKLKEIV